VGAAYTGEFVLGDVELEWKWGYHSLRVFMSSKGVIASFPMRGERRYRLILIPKGAPAGASGSPELSLEEFRSILSGINKEIHVTSATWLTRFRVHHRMVGAFRKGRLFLAGDAAHIHSPAGGQGMNIGIQDALNLSFKLAATLPSDREQSLLDAYEAERLPVARGVLRGTDFAFRGALLPERRSVAFIRRHVLPRLIGANWIQRRMIAAISEVSIARREIARYPEKGPD
jgi:2-polyprenyl-6-methoxyphenol hydroxylase-like FAD-dependent oxidoreductase